MPRDIRGAEDIDIKADVMVDLWLNSAGIVSILSSLQEIEVQASMLLSPLHIIACFELASIDSISEP